MSLKAFFLTIFFISWAKVILAQEIKIIFYYGINQLSDTVYFGYKPLATIGLDSFLGEKNIYNNPWNQFEARVFQRKKDNFSCAYKVSFPKDTTPVYFSQTFDSKRNYRSSTDTSYENRFFEITPLGTISDLTMRIIGDRPLTLILDSLLIFGDSCLGRSGVISSRLITSTREYVINSPSMAQLLFLFKARGLLSDRSPRINDIKIYPNPFKSQIIIDNLEIGNAKYISIFDILGREVFSKKDDFGEQIELDLKELSQGAFILCAFDKDSRWLFSKTIVKQ